METRVIEIVIVVCLIVLILASMLFLNITREESKEDLKDPYDSYCLSGYKLAEDYSCVSLDYWDKE